MKYVLILAALSIATHFRLDAQYKPSIYLNEENGLAGNLVKDISISQDGEIWFGTDNGLTIYDGITYTSYYQEDGLPSDKVWAIAHGLGDTSYLGCTDGGLAILKEKKVIQVLHFDGKYADKYRTFYYSEYYKTLFVGTEDGLYALVNNSLVEMNYQKDTSSRSLILAISGENKRIVFTVTRGLSEGIYELDFKENDPKSSISQRLSTNGRFSTILHKNIVYSGEYNKLRIIDPDSISDQVECYADTSYFIWEIEPFTNNLFWIGGLGDNRYDGGVKIFDTSSKSFLPSPFQMNDASVNALHYDEFSNVLWIGTDEGAFAYKESPFQYYTLPNSDIILDIEIQKGQVFAAGNDGVYMLEDGQFDLKMRSSYIDNIILNKYKERLSKDWEEAWKTYDVHSGVHVNSLVLVDDDLYLNTSKGSLLIGEGVNYLPFGNSTFSRTEKGHYLISVKYRPVYLMRDPKTTEFEIIEDNPKAYQSVISEFLYSNGTYYCPSYAAGLLVIRNDTSYRFDKRNSVVENNLVDAVDDKEGKVWILSVNGILYRFGNHIQPALEEVVDLKSIGCLGHNYKWLSITKGILFVATNHGLNAIPIKAITAKEGAFEYFFNRHNGYDFESANSPVIDYDGNLWVCNKSNVIKINPDQLKKYPIATHVQNLTVNSNSMKWEELEGAELPYNTKEVSFSFNAQKYPSSQNVLYRYKLNNGDWILGDQVVLSSLRSGAYTITLEVLDNEYKSRDQLHCNFSIKKPFWNTLGFFVFALLSLATFGYRLYVYRIKRIKKSHEEKTKLLVANAELQLRSLQGQMNPHFIFNALTSLQNFILEKDTKSSLVFLGNLSSIIRTNLENASEEYIDLEQELLFLNKYADIERLRFKEKVQINISNRVEEKTVLIPPMLIQPLIENSIKHGIGDQLIKVSVKIDVEFSSNNNQLKVCVKDNGVGRLQSKKHKVSGKQELGLSILRRRLSLLNELNHSDLHQINIVDLHKDGVPSGTVVEISLMLKMR